MTRIDKHRVVLVLAAIFALTSALFALYLHTLYKQLDAAFHEEKEFVPVTIYSDVTRLFPSQPRDPVMKALKDLGYAVQANADGDVTFTLHPIDYPLGLLPDNHPQAQDSGDQLPVALHFQGIGKDAPLQSIQISAQEVPDLYLEPELVATLTRGGATMSAKQIRKILKWNTNDDDKRIPPQIWWAIMSVEDQHFEEHFGLDPRGLARAMLVNLRSGHLRQGGSTITSQLVKNLMERKTRNIFRKFNELFLALLLEANFSKDQILERYLNEVQLGQVGSLEIRGIAEGSQYFFGRTVQELNLAEITMLAGQVRGTGYYSPYKHPDRAFDRMKLVLRKMVETGKIAQGEMDEALKMPVRLAPQQTVLNKAPYFVDFVKAELFRQLKGAKSEDEILESGFRVYTTLDMRLNQMAQEAVSDGIGALEKRFKIEAPTRLEGALAAVDQTTGSIRVLIGGRSYAQSTFNRILNMKRQVGSTFKPFVYLSAFQKGNDAAGVPYSPGYPAEDAPWKLVFDHGRQSWEPKNYEKEYMGWIPLRAALAHSINTVAARLGFEVGIDNVIKTAKSLGIESQLPAVPSVSLGVAELSPVELLRAYSVLADHGLANELTVLRWIAQSKMNVQAGSDGFYSRFVNHPSQVADPGPVDLVTDMLQNVFFDGTARDATQMGFDYPAAGKTGTTSHHRDSWFAGYTPQITTVVWVGEDMSTAPPPEATKPLKAGEKLSPKAEAWMKSYGLTDAQMNGTELKKLIQNRAKVNLTGATGALPLWVAFMKRALSMDPPGAFPISPYVENAMIDTHTGMLAAPNCPADQTAMEKFVKGKTPAASSCAANWPPEATETVAQ